ASGAGAGDNFADAFDVSVDDNLSLGLAYQAGSATVDGTGNTISDPAVVGDGVALAQTLTWQLADATADIDVTEGAIVTVTYDVLVLDNVLANQDLTNSAVAQWTSLDGISVVERNGTGAPAENDYVDGPATTTLTTPDTTTLTKTRLSDTWGPADSNVRVGDIIEYELRIGFQEGQHTNVSVSDTLPQGLAFEAVAHINGDNIAPYSAVTPFIHNDVTSAVVGNPVTGPSTVTFTIGDITNAGDNNAANDEFVIVYHARVLDNVHAQANNTVLTNNAQVDYTTAIGAIFQVATSDITLLQPDLSVAKVATPAGGDAEIVADELVTYTVSVTNNGTAPAYDLVLEDIIPNGLRNGTATITMVSTTLAGVPVGNIPPVYNPLTGVATWNFDSGVADAYTIGIGETLVINYQVQADTDLGAGLTITNAVTGTNYYSFDDEAVPTLGGVNGVREIYGPTNTATSTLTSPTAGALDKANPADTTVTIGETFTYLIRVPATPIPVALHDVRILDDISFAATGADLSLVSVAVSPLQTWAAPWTPANTGAATNLVIEDALVGIDIPAGEQAIIEVTVQVDDTGNNFDTVQFQNTADYTFNQYNDTPATQQNGLPDTTGFMTIVEPNQLTLLKTGPPTIRVGLPGTYTLNIHNTGTSPAYDLTIEDVLPNPVPGGMCDTTPYNITAQLYLADGTTLVGGPLILNTNFTMDFVFGTPTCDLTFTITTPATAIPADNRLIITYDINLDVDSVNNTSLTNVAGATEWFSGDTAGVGATGEIRTYTRTLNDSVTAAAALDHEDAFTTVTESPTIQFRKYVVNTTTGQDPGVDASPGDVLHYRIEAVNVSPVDLPNFSIIDDVDGLNTPPVFVQGSLQNVVVTGSTYTSNTDPAGGTNFTGIVDISDLSMSAAGGGSDTVTIEFDITLADVIDSGTLVLNQAQLQIYNLPALPSDDVNVNGADDPFVPGGEDPTQTLIASASLFQVHKTSDDITGSATDLLPGDTLRYTITVKNIGDENAINTFLQDVIPADTTYVPNSTTLNGLPVADVAGNSALQAGMLIYALEDPTPGAMRADADPLATNVATIIFDVLINDNAVEGVVISNQAQLTADGAGTSGAVAQPSDDPDVNGIDDPNVAGDEDPTLDTVSRPNGVIYDSISRQPLEGVTVRLLRASDNGRVPEACFSDPAQQDQVTSVTGAYKFNLVNFNAVDCPDGADYLISIIAAPQGYDVGFWPSRFIPPTSDATTAAYSVPVCPADAVAAPVGRCEARTTGTVPTGAVATPYYLHLTFSDNVIDNSTV
ncbi:MAG: isopeptide-forming domain-containing fimbrial protein, partial [Gammaproteobacteria bacterium]|nr:isopeptide-forming domain-containing fimbrial protein [Gammaproteobacteria bacterium]